MKISFLKFKVNFSWKLFLCNHRLRLKSTSGTQVQRNVRLTLADWSYMEPEPPKIVIVFVHFVLMWPFSIFIWVCNPVRIYGNKLYNMIWYEASVQALVDNVWLLRIYFRNATLSHKNALKYNSCSPSAQTDTRLPANSTHIMFCRQDTQFQRYKDNTCSGQILNYRHRCVSGVCAICFKCCYTI
jgi:hypothetical protein